MVSEIKSPTAGTPQAIDPSVRRIERGTQAEAARAADSNETVTLTDLAARLQQLTDAVRDVPVVDQARVGELRDALESGSYQVDERETADKLSAFESLVGRPGRG
jgi:negative regulator of flagellin synthesis FlgM